MTKHTKGPWIFHKNGDGTISFLKDNPEKNRKDWVLGVIMNGEQYPVVQVANAKLMCHAPEMYEAMKLFCERVEKGEVKSTKTYSQFKEILIKIES